MDKEAEHTLFWPGAVLLLVGLFLLWFALGSRAQDRPVFKTEVWGSNEMRFLGCIKLPQLPESAEQVCMVEDTKTHVRFVMDEIVSTSGGEAKSSLDGQGHWVR